MVVVYAIIVYDVAQERVSKVCQFLRTHLNWIQNSVFEGEIPESSLEKIKIKLAELIDKNSDSVIIYVLSSKKLVKRDRIGIEKSPVTNIL